jgi:hypothetical protein
MYSPTSYEGIAVGYWTLLVDYWTNNRTGYLTNYWLDYWTIENLCAGSHTKDPLGKSLSVLEMGNVPSAWAKVGWE